MKDRLAKLSEGQRECLRMVYRHMETKEIARALGISPDGVSQRIKAAMRTLGVDRRRDAARILAEAEQTPPYPSQVYPSRGVAIAPDPVMFAVSTGSERQSGSSGGAMKEEQAPFQPAPPVPSPEPLPPNGGVGLGDVGIWKRLTWIVAIVIGVAIAFGGLIAGVDALVRLIVALNR
jgi:DNA-binding CsgD family transcriptional regulator